PDIAEGGGPEQRVGDGMKQHVRVGMPFQAELRWNGQAANDERLARHGAMNVPAKARPVFSQDATRPAVSLARIRRANSISDGFVILMLRSLPATTLTSMSRLATKLDSSVPMNPSSFAF